jgi:phosphohistidine phosphatase
MVDRRILVMRHAKSDWTGGDQDFDRPLSGRGRRAAAAMGVYMADEGLRPELVLCSAARRAADTWAMVARSGTMAPRVVADRGLYLAAAGDLLARVRALDDAVASVLFVGHAPGIDGFAGSLVAKRSGAAWRRMAEKFPTGALAVLDASAAHWRDVDEGVAELERFVVPKDLV